MSGRGKRLDKSPVKRLNRAARSYNRRVGEYLTARDELAGVGDQGDVERLNGLLDVEAVNLREAREVLLDSARNLGVCVPLAEPV